MGRGHQVLLEALLSKSRLVKTFQQQHQGSQLIEESSHCPLSLTTEAEHSWICRKNKPRLLKKNFTDPLTVIELMIQNLFWQVTKSPPSLFHFFSDQISSVCRHLDFPVQNISFRDAPLYQYCSFLTLFKKGGQTHVEITWKSTQ